MRQLIKMGNPTLRQKALNVNEKEISSVQIQTLIDELIQSMRQNNGVGIAATQLAVLSRIFVIEIADNPRYPGKENFPLLLAINPVIKITTEQTTYDWEGCLSIPGLRGKVERFDSLQLEYFDRKGEFHSIPLAGFPAIVAQHENDHLDGILFIDRMKDTKTLTFLDEYHQYWQNNDSNI